MKNVSSFENMFSDYCIKIISDVNTLNEEILKEINQCQNEIKITIYSEIEK